MKDVRREVARILIEKDCLILRPSEPFTYASGLKGPMYCDNRKILSHINEREFIVQCFKDLLEKENIDFDHVAPMATAGIPHGTLLADRIKKSLIYIRSKPKGHGRTNQIEGNYKEGERLLLVEDLVNQGKSLAEGLDGVLAAKLIPSACLSIVDYQMPSAKERLDGYKVKLYSLTDLDSIIETAKALEKISDKEAQVLKEWRLDPKEWSKSYEN